MYTYTDHYANYGEGAWSEASYAYNHDPGSCYYYPNSYYYYGQEAYGGEQFGYQEHQYYAREAGHPSQHQYYQDQQCFIQTLSYDSTANGEIVRNEVHYVYYFNQQYGTYVFSHTYQTNTVLKKDEKDVSPKIEELDVSKDDGCAKDPIAACMYSKAKRLDQLEWRQEENPSFNEELDSSESSQDKVTDASDEVNASLKKLMEQPSLESVQIFASATELDDGKDGKSSIQEVADIASDNASKVKSFMMQPSLQSVNVFELLEPCDNDSTLPDVVEDFEQTVEKPMPASTDAHISPAVECDNNNFSSDSERRVNDTDNASKMKPFMMHPSLESVNIFELEPNDSTLPDAVEDSEQTVKKPVLESAEIQFSTAVEFDSDGNSALNPEEHTVVSKPVEEEPSAESCGEPSGWRKYLRKLNVFASAACEEIAICYIKGMLL